MNNSKSCVPYVYTSSGHKQVCERHNSKFFNYSITKYIKFNQLTTNKNIHLTSEINLSFMETVSEIVLYIFQEFLLKDESFNCNYCCFLNLMYFVME